VNILQKSELTASQGKELCDSVANMLKSTLEAQDIDFKVKAAVGLFIAHEKLNIQVSELSQKLSWSIKVRLEK
jgi:hypothetical protein